MPTKELQRPSVSAAPTLPLRRRLTAFDRLLDTPPLLLLTVARWLLGGVMFAHASQKVFGWFGGPGWSGTIQGFHDQMHIPTYLAVAAVLAEFLGSIGLILGFLGRLSAVAILAVMIGAISLVHYPFGFWMNWYGKAPGEGFEYHLLAIGLCAAILAMGSGGLSVDRAILRARRSAD